LPYKVPTGTRKAPQAAPFIMRPWWAAALLVAALASSGCLFQPVCGPSRWTEPGLTTWLEANGEAGFERFEAAGFEPGPRMSARLPDGARLSSAEYSRSVGRQMMHMSITSHDIMLSADGSTKASVASVTRFLNGTLDKVYRGDAADRAFLLEQVAAGWEKAPRTRDQSPFVSLNFTGDWDFEGEFGRGSRFTRDSVGTFVAYGGEEGFLPKDNWIFSAQVGSWGHYGNDTYLAVDDLGAVEMGIGARSAEEVKEQARALAPDYAWEFQDFHFGGRCPFL
jgi:hypothetical protein